MGERLNLEIIENEKVLANSYYHWSAYTTSALELTKIALKHLKENTEGNSAVRAVKALEATGAGLTVDELEELKKQFPDVVFNKATSRNDGLIAITEKGIGDTQFWAEGTVKIDITDLTIDFQAIRLYTEEQYKEYYEKDDTNSLKVVPDEIDLNSLTEEHIPTFEALCKEAIDDRTYAFKTKNNMVYGLVE